MRTELRFATLGVMLFVAAVAPAADEPAPLLKPVTPPTGSLRVRIPIDTSSKYTDSRFVARAAKVKKGEYADVRVAFDTQPGKSHVSTKMWQSWGYEVPANKVVVLPELIVPAVQLAPKVSKGRDVEVKLPSITLEVVDPPGDSDQVFDADLYIRINDLTKNAERAFEPRFYFGDKTLELTVPTSAIKRLGTGDEVPPEPGVTAEPSLVIASGATVVRGLPVMAYSSINGLTKYKTPDGKEEHVTVGVSSNSNWPGGIMLTMGTARGCGVELDNDKDLTSKGATFEGQVAKGKVKEFRLGFSTGPGFKAQKDLVLKDVTVYVDKNASGHFVWLGSKFVNDHLKDGVYAMGADGAWKLLGRANPDELQDIKTRMPPPKK
jgi:hypothetical protein